MSLVAEGLSFAYPGADPLFEGMTLTVEPGERVAITAPSGAGKTTLCRILAGYLEPRHGRVTVDGAPLAASTRAAGRDGAVRRKRMRRVPAARAIARPVQLIAQHPEQAFDPLFRMRESLAEALPAKAASKALGDIESSGLMARFGIRQDWLERYPHELSGGELMRCCIVRALAARPRYLICDEMTAMLDAVTQAELWHEVIDIVEARGMGVVFVSHSPALVERVATRVVPLA